MALKVSPGREKKYPAAVWTLLSVSAMSTAPTMRARMTANTEIAAPPVVISRSTPEKRDGGSTASGWRASGRTAGVCPGSIDSVSGVRPCSGSCWSLMRPPRSGSRRPSSGRAHRAGVSPGTMPTILPRYITAIRSASAVTSSSSVETTMTGMPASRAATILRVHELHRSDIQSSGRLRGDEQAQVAAELAGDHHLLLVAAGELAGVGADALRADVEFGDLVLGELGQIPQLQVAEAHEGRPGGAVSIRFSAIVNSLIRPSSCRSSGMKPTPASRIFRTRQPLQIQCRRAGCRR